MLHFCEYWDIPVAGAPKATISPYPTVKQYTTNKDLRASILHFLWLLWVYQSSEATISPYPTVSEAYKERCHITKFSENQNISLRNGHQMSP